MLKKQRSIATNVPKSGNFGRQQRKKQREKKRGREKREEKKKKRKKEFVKRALPVSYSPAYQHYRNISA